MTSPLRNFASSASKRRAGRAGALSLSGREACPAGARPEGSWGGPSSQGLPIPALRSSAALSSVLEVLGLLILASAALVFSSGGLVFACGERALVDSSSLVGFLGIHGVVKTGSMRLGVQETYKGLVEESTSDRISRHEERSRGSASAIRLPGVALAKLLAGAVHGVPSTGEARGEPPGHAVSVGSGLPPKRWHREGMPGNASPEEVSPQSATSALVDGMPPVHCVPEASRWPLACWRLLPTGCGALGFGVRAFGVLATAVWHAGGDRAA